MKSVVITAEQARQIYSLHHKDGMAVRAVAKKLTIAESVCRHVICGRSWARETGATPGYKVPRKMSHFPIGQDRFNSKLTDEKVREIRAQVAAGDMQKDVARRFGVVISVVSNVVNRKKWGHVK